MKTASMADFPVTMHLKVSQSARLARTTTLLKLAPTHAHFYNKTKQQQKIQIQTLYKINSLLSLGLCLMGILSLKECGKLFAMMATRIPPMLHTFSSIDS